MAPRGLKPLGALGWENKSNKEDTEGEFNHVVVELVISLFYLFWPREHAPGAPKFSTETTSGGVRVVATS